MDESSASVSVLEKLATGLYVVATPLGHARDITLRALDVLRSADVIYCEDTRQTAKLAALYNIKTRRRAYHDHNAHKIRPQILKMLAAGAAVALVSDAGTPLISDPGQPLVRDAHAGGHAVFAVPGASAPIAALSVAGLPSDKFAFIGFLPTQSSKAQQILAALAQLDMTLIFFESPRRLPALLKAFAVFGAQREIVVARELTKIFEELVRGTCAEVAAHFIVNPPRGEVTVLVAPPQRGHTALDSLTDADLDDLLRLALAQMSLRDAVQQVMAASGEKRKRVYAAALILAGNKDEQNEQK